jgi:hypothetical protein
MANYTFTEIDVPEAERLCDLTGIKQDLESAIGFAEALQKYYYEPSISDALNVAVLVRYSRAFGKSVRANLTDADVSSILSKEELVNHQRFRALRSKHIAHSVNAYESHQFVARYCQERIRTEGVTSVAVTTTRVMLMAPHDIHILIELAKHLIRHVVQEIKEEEQRLLPLVRKIPVNELLRIRRKGFPKQGAAQLVRPRAKLSKIEKS